jgi:hypothetical protein
LLIRLQDGSTRPLHLHYGLATVHGPEMTHPVLKRFAI